MSNRFDTTFKNYEISPVHRDSPTLAKTAAIFENEQNLNICDVGCGAGHFGLKLSPSAKSITFVDPSEKMLSLLKEKTAGAEGLHFVQSTAEKLDFPSESFDVVVTRLATHHFSNIQQSVAEMVRVLKKGGHLIINDLSGYEDTRLDEINHQIEVLHDPTHGRSYKPSQWKSFLTLPNLEIEDFKFSLESPSGITIDFWCSITKVGQDKCDSIKHILNTFTEQDLKELGYSKKDGELLNHVKTVYIIARKV